MTKIWRPKKKVETCNNCEGKNCKCKDKVFISKESVSDWKLSKSELLKELADRDIELDNLSETIKNLKLDFNDYKISHYNLMKEHKRVSEKCVYLLDKIDKLKMSLALRLVISVIATWIAAYLAFFA